MNRIIKKGLKRVLALCFGMIILLSLLSFVGVITGETAADANIEAAKDYFKGGGGMAGQKIIESAAANFRRVVPIVSSISVLVFILGLGAIGYKTYRAYTKSKEKK